MLIESFGQLDLEALTIHGVWLVPDAGSLMFGLINQKGEKVEFFITQIQDLDDYIEDQIPGRIYVNEELLPLGCAEEKDLMQVLRVLIQNKQLGHPQGFEAIRAQETITFFESDQAMRMHEYLTKEE